MISDQEGAVSQKELTPYEKLPQGLQRQWDERYFNAVKLRTLLLSADAVLTWAFILWVGFAMLIVSFNGYSPERFPLHFEYAYSLGVFFVYYAIVGFARRQTEAYIVKLRTQRSDVEEGALKRPFSEENDPLPARIAFGLRKVFRIPRRGLGQYAVVAFQFLAGLVYVGNYGFHVLWLGDVRDASHPSVLWLYHAVVTGGGLLIIIKYGGFLVDTKKLLTAIEGLVGSVFGGVHAHVETTVTSEGAKKDVPCKENETKK